MCKQGLRFALWTQISFLSEIFLRSHEPSWSSLRLLEFRYELKSQTYLHRWYYAATEIQRNKCSQSWHDNQICQQNISHLKAQHSSAMLSQHLKAASNNSFTSDQDCIYVYMGFRWDVKPLQISFWSIKRTESFGSVCLVNRHRRDTSKWTEISLRAEIWLWSEISDLPHVNAA